jgi:hypothetical protein
MTLDVLWQHGYDVRVRDSKPLYNLVDVQAIHLVAVVKVELGRVQNDHPVIIHSRGCVRPR